MALHLVDPNDLVVENFVKIDRICHIDIIPSEVTKIDIDSVTHYFIFRIFLLTRCVFSYFLQIFIGCVR